MRKSYSSGTLQKSGQAELVGHPVGCLLRGHLEPNGSGVVAQSFLAKPSRTTRSRSCRSTSTSRT